LERDYDYAMDWLKAAREAYEVGVLDNETFPQELALFIADPERIKLYHAIEMYKKLPKIKRGAAE